MYIYVEVITIHFQGRIRDRWEMKSGADMNGREVLASENLMKSYGHKEILKVVNPHDTGH